MAQNKRVRSQSGRIQSTSFAEVREGLRAAALAVERDLKIQGEKWEPGHLLECWAADGMTMPRDEQIRRAKRGQVIIERIRLRDVPGPPLGPDDDAVKESVEGNHCNVPRTPGRGKALSKPGADPDPGLIFRARPVVPKKR